MTSIVSFAEKRRPRSALYAAVEGHYRCIDVTHNLANYRERLSAAPAAYMPLDLMALSVIGLFAPQSDRPECLLRRGINHEQAFQTLYFLISEGTCTSIKQREDFMRPEDIVNFIGMMHNHKENEASIEEAFKVLDFISRHYAERFSNPVLMRFIEDICQRADMAYGRKIRGIVDQACRNRP